MTRHIWQDQKNLKRTAIDDYSRFLQGIDEEEYLQLFATIMPYFQISAFCPILKRPSKIQGYDCWIRMQMFSHPGQYRVLV